MRANYWISTQFGHVKKSPYLLQHISTAIQHVNSELLMHCFLHLEYFVQGHGRASEDCHELSRTHKFILAFNVHWLSRFLLLLTSDNDHFSMMLQRWWHQEQNSLTLRHASRCAFCRFKSARIRTTTLMTSKNVSNSRFILVSAQQFST